MLGATLFGAGALFASPQVASAKEVADGGLPPGIAEYMGVIKSKKQWNQIGKRVSEGQGEIPKSEWENIQVRAFLAAYGDREECCTSILLHLTRRSDGRISTLTVSVCTGLFAQVL